jgi:hypothetical protein
MPREINGEIYFSIAEAAAKMRVTLLTMGRWIRDAELGIRYLDVSRDGRLRFISQRSLRRAFDPRMADESSTGDEQRHAALLSREHRTRRSQVRSIAKRSESSEPEFYSCFISYSHADQAFAFRLHDALQHNGIRCWLDARKLKVGDDIYEQVSIGIQLWDKMLLCCSRHSLTSWWVDNEIATAFEKEQQMTRDHGERILVLIPLNLDGHLLSGEWKSGKAAQVRQRLAADFTEWELDDQKFDRQVKSLIQALRTDDADREPVPSSKLGS